MDAQASVSAAQLNEWPPQAAVLDVREIGEYEAGHIPRATTLCRARLEFDVRAVVPDLGAQIALYDGGDGRAQLARATLAGLGYRQVAVLQGGLPAWVALGLPVHSGTNVPSKLFGEKLLHEEHLAEVTALQLAQEQKDGLAPLVLDVRTRQEHLRGCIPGALHLAGGEMISAAAQLARLGRPVVTHCAGRTRSLVAAATLRALGVADVRALRNGTMGWMLEDLKLETPAGDKADFELDPDGRSEAAALLRERFPVTTVAPAELLEGRVSATYIFDVRRAAEYEAGHLPGALHVPGGQLVQCADDHIALRHGQIVVTSANAVRATAAAWWLSRMGFPHVRVLEGGLQAWQEVGGTLAQGGRPQPDVPDVAPAIDAADLLALMNSSHPPVVLDLGSSLRYQRRHVPGAHWLSRGWLEDAVPRHLPDRSCALVLTGASWPQMQLAAASLAALGYGDVRVLRASVEQWAGEGCPVARGMDSAWSEVRDVANAGILRGDRDAMRRYLDWEIALTAA